MSSYRPVRFSLFISVLLVCAGGAALATMNPAITVNVDAAANRGAINPLIYGVNWGTTSQLADLNCPFNRSGGDNMTRYNWLANAFNEGDDWYYESIPYASSVAGEQGDTFISETKAASAQSMLTIPLIDWIAKLGPNRSELCSFSQAKYGAQTDSDPYWSDAGNGILADGQYVTGNDPNDANIASNSTYQQGWVQHIVSTWGSAASGGLKYYGMDNESSIWFQVHRDVEPTGAKMATILNKIIDYAGMIKAVDSSALVVGPEEWGWSGYEFSGYDQQYGAAHNYSSFPEYDAIDGEWYLPWLLQQLSKNAATTGQRLLDVFSVHYYPQGNAAGDQEFSDNVSTTTELLRNRSTRSLWDPTYVDQSWIGTVVDLVPLLKGWVASYYPGTQIGLTEYCWGADAYINGATAQADILGILGREGVDIAARWEAPDSSTPTYKAFKIYRNYDGNKSTFGDVSVSATGPNPDNCSVFAAQRSSDAALTVMLVNKVLTLNTPATINIADFNVSGTAQVWQLTSANTIKQLANIPLSGTSLSLTLPPQSITLLVMSSANGTSTCGAALQGKDGANLMLGNEVVTAIFPADGVIYAEQPDRSAGIRVVCSQTNLSVGDRVNIAGTLGTRTVSGVTTDRQISSAAVVRVSSGTPLNPLGIYAKTIGASTGPTRLGLLLKVWGRVSQVSGNNIYVDDGSGFVGPTGIAGIEVQCAAAPGVSVGDFVSATGVAVGNVPSGATQSCPCIQLRQASDLYVMALGH